MSSTVDISDLQLEDVEDYSADYPNYPDAEQNIAAMEMQPEPYKNKRTNRLVYLIRENVWVSAFITLIVILGIAVISILARSSRNAPVKASSSSGGAHQMPIHVDPKTLDPEVVESLKEKIMDVYNRKGLDLSVLESQGTVTPQTKALNWLASNENLDSLDHTQLMQRYTLAVFYYATNAISTPYDEDPEPWFNAHLWLSREHACRWKGIVCNEQNHIEAIGLERNNLTGALPPELKIIGSTLKSLDLTSNLLFMEDEQFDIFSELTELEHLLMDDNYLSYERGLPSQFKALTNLKRIRLSYNLFGGELEKEHKVLSAMSQLTHLELESNFFSGTFPSVIGELTNLVYIYMRRNELDMSLDFLKAGKLRNLFALWLDNNYISGTIPTEIGLLTQLASVSITNATLTGTIPTEMSNLVNLRRMWLYNNEMSGTIPPALNELSLLEVLEVHHNNIGGAMPFGICANIKSSQYTFKSLTSDCLNEVQCEDTCCTECF